MNLVINKSIDGKSGRMVNIAIKNIKSIVHKQGLGVAMLCDHHHERGQNEAYDIALVEFLSVVTFTASSIDDTEYNALVASVLGPEGILHVVVDDIGDGLYGRYRGELFNYQTAQEARSLTLTKAITFPAYLNLIHTGDFYNRFVKHQDKFYPEEAFDKIIEKE